MDQYHNKMVEFLNKTGTDVQGAQVGNQVIKCDPITQEVLVGHAKDGTITPATHIFVEVKPAGKTGTIHSFPVSEDYPVTPRAGF